LETETIVVLLLTAAALASVVWLNLHSRRTARATPSAYAPEDTTQLLVPDYGPWQTMGTVRRGKNESGGML